MSESCGPGRVVVVGGSVGGISVAERLREAGYTGDVMVLSAEEVAPYDRPPLSKQYLDDSLAGGRDALLLRPEAWYAERDIDLRLGVRVSGLSTGPRGVVTGAGLIEAGHVVIATGTRPRTVPAWERSGARVLRTLGDADRLGERLRASAGSLVVVGGGFIGLEVAGTAAALGWQVTVVERESAPLSRVLPAELARICVERSSQAGVQIITGTVVDELVGEPLRGVLLHDGRMLPADLVVVGIGGEPVTDWLEGSRLAIDDGVVCDATGRTSESGVWAVGDVARWPNRVTGRHDRVEQWQAARDHGRIVADAIVAEEAGAGTEAPVWDSAPYFWTNLFGRRVQFAGHIAPEMAAHVTVSGRKTVAVVGDHRLRGVFVIDAPRALALGRRLLLRNTSLEEAAACAATALPDGRQTLSGAGVPANSTRQ
jgi:3-phenylpropionate/trans-cinnamate dioxygenase ferredoxin reductase component